MHPPSHSYAVSHSRISKLKWRSNWVTKTQPIHYRFLTFDNTKFLSWSTQSSSLMSLLIHCLRCNFLTLIHLQNLIYQLSSDSSLLHSEWISSIFESIHDLCCLSPLQPWFIINLVDRIRNSKSARAVFHVSNLRFSLRFQIREEPMEILHKIPVRSSFILLSALQNRVGVSWRIRNQAIWIIRYYCPCETVWLFTIVSSAPVIEVNGCNGRWNLPTPFHCPFSPSYDTTTTVTFYFGAV